MKKLLVRALKLGGLLVSIGFVGFCGLVNFVNLPSKGERDREARANAQQQVELLRAYYSDHGTYPKTLGELSPGYAARLPEPREGHSFEYVPDPEGQDFTLAYPEAPMGALPSDGSHSYRASSGEWEFTVR
jgi:type II secretory pathway pseudopilin PulG